MQRISRGRVAPAWRVAILCLVAALLAVGCTPLLGSGRAASQDYELSGFARVYASHGFEADVRQGDAYSVRVTTDDNILDDVVVEVSGDALSIGLPTGTFTTSRLQAEVTLPALREVRASGGSRVSFSGFSEEGESFRAEGSGGARVEGEAFAEEMRIDLSGGSRATISGSAERLEVTVSGGGNADFSDLEVQDADVNVSGGSSATVNVRDTLDATASGGATVRYIGNPTIGRENVSGGGAVRPD